MNIEIQPNSKQMSQTTIIKINQAFLRNVEKYFESVLHNSGKVKIILNFD